MTSFSLLIRLVPLTPSVESVTRKFCRWWDWFIWSFYVGKREGECGWRKYSLGINKSLSISIFIEKENSFINTLFCFWTLYFVSFCIIRNGSLVLFSFECVKLYWLTARLLWLSHSIQTINSLSFTTWKVLFILRNFLSIFILLNQVVSTSIFTVIKNNIFKMQRPNFQMIEELPEKNYMRFVSQYKLDDMVSDLAKSIKQNY